MKTGSPHCKLLMNVDHKTDLLLLCYGYRDIGCRGVVKISLIDSIKANMIPVSHALDTNVGRCAHSMGP